MSKFSLQPEDGTVQNGDIRGDDSTDLQVARDNASEVASGYASVLIGGYGNTADGQYAAAFGSFNVSSGVSSLAIGSNCQSLGDYSLSGGLSCFANGAASTSLGYECIANGANSVMLFAVNGISDNTAVASYAVGTDPNTYLPMQWTRAGGNFSGPGDAQVSSFVARAQVFNAGPITPIVPLISKGTLIPIVPKGSNRAWSFLIDIIVVCTDQGSGSVQTGETYKSTLSGIYKVVGGTASVSSITTSNVASDTNMSSISFSVTPGAGNSFGLAGVTPTGSNVSDFRCVANITLTEVAW